MAPPRAQVVSGTPPAEHRIGPQAFHSDSRHPLNPGSIARPRPYDRLTAHTGADHGRPRRRTTRISMPHLSTYPQANLSPPPNPPRTPSPFAAASATLLLHCRGGSKTDRRFGSLSARRAHHYGGPHMSPEIRAYMDYPHGLRYTLSSPQLSQTVPQTDNARVTHPGSPNARLLRVPLPCARRHALAYLIREKRNVDSRSGRDSVHRFRSVCHPRLDPPPTVYERTIRVRSAKFVCIHDRRPCDIDSKFVHALGFSRIDNRQLVRQPARRPRCSTDRILISAQRVCTVHSCCLKPF